MLLLVALDLRLPFDHIRDSDLVDLTILEVRNDLSPQHMVFRIVGALADTWFDILPILLNKVPEFHVEIIILPKQEVSFPGFCLALQIKSSFRLLFLCSGIVAISRPNFPFACLLIFKHSHSSLPLHSHRSVLRNTSC